MPLSALWSAASLFFGVSYFPSRIAAARFSFASRSFNARVTDALGSSWVLDDCDAWVSRVAAFLDEVLRPGDVVATTTANWKYDVADDVDYDFVAELSARVHARGATFLVLGDVPLLYGTFGVNCASPETRRDCDLDQGLARPAKQDDAETAWTALRTAKFFRTFDLFCDAGTCGAYAPGTDVLAVVDYGHLSTAGSLYVAPFLSCFLEAEGLVSPPPPDPDAGTCPASLTDV